MFQHVAGAAYLDTEVPPRSQQESRRQFDLGAYSQDFLTAVQSSAGVKAPRQAPNPYESSFLAFLRDCCFTIDKALAGKIREWPFEGEWATYWQDWETALLDCHAPLLIDKTRRTMASNVLCAWELWLLGGGTDPRWPVLAESQQNRLIIIQAMKLGRSKQDEGCSAEFVARAEAMYHLMVERGLRERWPGYPEVEWGFGWGKAANGGKILAVPEGPDQLRGPGVLWLRMEELGGWNQAEVTCAVALPTLYPLGRACAVTTPAIGTYAHEIVQGKVATGHDSAPKTIPITRKLPLTVRGDWYVLEIRGERDIPGYVPAEVGRGMPKMAFRREVLGDWTATTGKLVYPEYGDIHEPNQPLPFDPQRPLIICWDAPSGTGGTPAMVPTQISAAGQWCIYNGIQGGDEVEGYWAFIERCAQFLYEEFAAPDDLELSDLELIHYGDPAGNARPVAGGMPSQRGEIRSFFEVANLGEEVPLGHDANGKAIVEKRPGRGWVIRGGEVQPAKGIEAIRARLTTLLPGGAPALVVDVGATQIRAAFKGGYHFKQRADGQYELDPEKNEYSHPMDALRYGASRLFAARGKRDRDEDERPRRAAVRAPGRPRQ